MRVLLLEDDYYKAMATLNKLQDRVKFGAVFWTGYQSEAEFFVRAMCPGDPVTLILDGELHPGAGTGVQFLEWMISERKLINEVYISTNSIKMRADMVQMCTDANIDYDICTVP